MCLCITLTNVEGSLYLGNNNNNKKKRFSRRRFSPRHESGRRYFKAAGLEVVMYMKTFQSCVPVASAWVRFGLRNRKQPKKTAWNGSYLDSPWLWLTEQVKNPALGRRCWLGARSTSTAAGRSDPASIKRTASGGHLSIIVWWGQRAAELYSN